MLYKVVLHLSLGRVLSVNIPMKAVVPYFLVSLLIIVSSNRNFPPSNYATGNGE